MAEPMTLPRTPAPTEAERIALAQAEAEALRKAGAHREAIAILDARLREHPRSGRLWHARMLSCRALGDVPEALRCCEEILALQPANAVALRGRIDIATRFGLVADLPRYVEEACERVPDHLPFHLRCAALLREAGRVQEALDALAPHRAAHPADAGLLAEIAATLRVLGRHAESLAACEAAPADATDPRLTTLRIDALLRLGRAAEALTVAEQALAARPGQAALGLRRGQALRDLGRHADSVAWLADLDRQHPGNASILSQLAASQRVAGEHAASLATLERLLAADPGHRGARLARIEVLQLAGDHGGIAAMVAQAAAGLRQAGDEAAFHATIIGKALPHLDDEAARRVLRQNAIRLAALAATLPPEVLWAIYRRADTLGMGVDYAPLAAALLGREGLRFSTARTILRTSFAVGLPNWQRVGARLLPHVQPADRGLFRTELARLSGLPAEALAGRERNPPHVTADHVLQVSALLLQMGRVRVAARYMGFAYRRFPDSSAVLRDYLFCLASTAQVDRARAVLEAQEPRLAGLPAAWREVVAQGWAEIDQPRRGMALIDGPGPHGWRDWYVAHALAAADRADWPTLSARFRDGPRVATSLRGALLVESLRHADTDLPEHELTITAIARLDRWMQEAHPAQPSAQLSAHPPAGPAVPHNVVQYWSQATPPPQVQAAVASWRQAEGFEHRLFNRSTAQQFLHRELGRDWLRAFNRAGSPTEESDFFRLCRIGLQGGIYADCDDWLTGDPAGLIDPAGRLTVWREPTGAVGNNLISAPPRHPVLLWAAISARNALLEGHGDNVWVRSGPGLLTRAIVWRIGVSAAAGTDPNLRILPRWQLGRAVQFHSPLSYKSGAGYWNRRNTAGSLTHLSRAAGRD